MPWIVALCNEDFQQDCVHAPEPQYHVGARRSDRTVLFVASTHNNLKVSTLSPSCWVSA